MPEQNDEKILFKTNSIAKEFKIPFISGAIYLAVLALLIWLIPLFEALKIPNLITNLAIAAVFIIPLGLFIRRVLVDRMFNQRESYIITDKRIIIKKTLPSPSTSEIKYGHIRDIKIRKQKEGSIIGTISLDNVNKEGLIITTDLKNIKNVDNIYEIIIKLTGLDVSKENSELKQT
ncbi:MAG: PH domain-containing protein [Nanoarchaeota archaeon]|nr:PH domain-containing protein [Nanoarchaeota archaeon]